MDICFVYGEKMNIATLITDYRDIFGLSASIYTDAMLTTRFNKAAKKISEYYPKINFDYVLTVKDQTRYSITKTGLLKLAFVYYNQGFDYSMTFDPEIPQNLSFISSFTPSQTFELISRLKLLRELYPSEGQIVSYDTFDLLPTPTTDNTKVYYEYNTFRSVAEIPDIFEDELFDLCTYYLAEKEYAKVMLSQTGNRYFFERRGNTTVEKSTYEMTNKARAEMFKYAVDSIKTKAMKL